MQRTADVVRYVFNLALEQRRDFWRQAKVQGVRFNYITQGYQVTALRQECTWIASVSYTPLTYALKHLDAAFQSFFRGGGFPGFRCKDRHNAFCQQGHQVRF